MRLTTITTCNNYNNVYLRIPKIYNLKFINLTITGKSLPKYIWNFMTTRFILYVNIIALLLLKHRCLSLEISLAAWKDGCICCG